MRELVKSVMAIVGLVILALLFFSLGEHAGYQRGYFEGRLAQPNSQD